MPVTSPTDTHDGVRRTLEAGMLLLGAGAILLLVSLFVNWYEPGHDAWTVFEVWDLALAALAIAALVAVAGRLGFGPARPDSWLVVPAAVALLVIVATLIDPPPAVREPAQDPMTGLWLALAATILMAAGAMLSVARISVAISRSGPLGGHGAPAAPVVPGAAAPQRGGRFGHGSAEPADPLGTEPTRPLAGGDAPGYGQPPGRVR